MPRSIVCEGVGGRGVGGMRIGKYWLLRPYEAFGNRCEDLYFALLKCRREGLRLVLLKRKWNLIAKVRFRPANRELLEIRHPVIVTNFLVDVLGYFLTIAWSFARVLGIGCRKLCSVLGSKSSQSALVAFSEMEIGREELWGEIVAPYQANSQAVCWGKEFVRRLNVSYRPRAELDANFPILKGRRYICLHVRTGGFFCDHDYSSPRNADISNYLPAIEWLIAQSYIVVRLGDPAMPPLDVPGVLDYAHCSLRSEANDVHLVEHCEYYLGSQTGPIDLAALFEKRILTINGLSLSHCFWYRHGSLLLPKHALLEGRRLSLKEQIDLRLFEVTGTGHLDSRIQYEENTAEEILASVKDFLSLAELTPEQKMFNLYLSNNIETYFEETQVWSDHMADASQKIRWISRLKAADGSVAPSYLESNWP